MRYFELLSEGLKGSYIGLNFSDRTNKNLFNYCKELEIPNHLVEFHSTLFISSYKINDPAPEGMYPIIIPPNRVRHEIFNQYDLGYIAAIKFSSDAIKSRYSHLASKYNSLVKLRSHVSLAYGLKKGIEFTKYIDFPLEIVGEYIDVRQSPGDARKSMQTV